MEHHFPTWIYGLHTETCFGYKSEQKKFGL